MNENDARQLSEPCRDGAELDQGERRPPVRTGDQVRVRSGRLEGTVGVVSGSRGDRLLIKLPTARPAYLETDAESVQVVEKKIAS